MLVPALGGEGGDVGGQGLHPRWERYPGPPESLGTQWWVSVDLRGSRLRLPPAMRHSPQASTPYTLGSHTVFTGALTWGFVWPVETGFWCADVTLFSPLIPGIIAYRRDYCCDAPSSALRPVGQSLDRLQFGHQINVGRASWGCVARYSSMVFEPRRLLQSRWLMTSRPNMPFGPDVATASRWSADGA